jgi:hypothetical protein
MAVTKPAPIVASRCSGKNENGLRDGKPLIFGCGGTI